MTTIVAMASLVGVGVVAPQAARASTVAVSPAEGFERPDLLGAQLLAASSGHRVLVTGLTTETSQSWVNADGSVSLEQATGPVRVKRAGAWLPVDTRLRAAQGHLEPTVTPSTVTFSAGGDSSLASVAAGAAKVSLGWSGPLPAPSVSGDRATYGDVTPGVDMVLQALPTGFEQSIVLKSRPASTPTFKLPLGLSGVSTTTLSSGDFELRDSNSAVHVGDIGVPVMYDSADTVRPNSARMSASITRNADGSAVLNLTPDTKMLNDPTTVYPVTLDPVTTLQPSADTSVKLNNGSTNYGSSTTMAVGQVTTNVSDDNRGLVQFSGLSALAGKQLVSAQVRLDQTISVSCTPSLTSFYQVTSAWTSGGATWLNQPSINSTSVGSFTASSGGACGAHAYQSTASTSGMLGLVSGWANGTITNYGLSVRADESTSAAGKYFSTSESPYPPLLDVTYNAAPTVPSSLSITPCYGHCALTTATGSTRPSLSGQSTDAEGSAVTYAFEVYAGSANPPGGAAVQSGTVPSVTSGQRVTWQLPTPLAAGTYEYRVQATDASGAASGWSPYAGFTVDTTAPSAPTVTSSVYTNGQWSSPGFPGDSAPFTFTKNPADSDVYQYTWRWDDGPSGSALASGTSNTLTLSWNPGWRTLSVAAVDQAGNRSAETTFSFGHTAAVTSPGNGATTQRYVHLKANAATGSASVTWNYYNATTSTWTALPLTGGAVTDTSLNAVTSWPVATVPDSVKTNSPELIFDLTSVLGGTGTAQDGAVQLQAVFSNTTNSTSTNYPTVSLNQNAFGDSYATAPVGPGTVSLLTGNYSVSATDASIDSYGSDLTLSRTFNSRTATNPGIFGPGWLPSMTVNSASSTYIGLTDLGGTVRVTEHDAAQLIFAKVGTGGTYIAQGPAEGLTLIASGGDSNGPTTFEISTESGDKTTFSVSSNWTSPAGPSSIHSFSKKSVTKVGDASPTTYVYDVDGNLSSIIAPQPSGVTTCATSFVAGCRALNFTYISVAGNTQLKKATIATFDGVSGSSISADVACYTYDGTTGKLLQAWDPRLETGGLGAHKTCNTPVLATTYTYDTTGRLTTVTPPGLAGWTIAYDGPGLTARLSTVTRTHTGGSYGTGSETSTVRYDLPIGNDSDATTGLHPDLSPTTVATWAQTDLPRTATAIFSPGDSVPALPYSAADFRDGTITALDEQGRAVNTASYTGTGQAGWRIDTTEYDSIGHTLRSLNAANRDRALARPDAGADTIALPADTAAASRLLDTVNQYALNTNDPRPEKATQLDLVDTFGPLHQVVLPDGTLAPARAHTHLTYDIGSETGHPTGGSLRLIVASTVGASLSGSPTATNETDQRTTTNAYSLTGESTGWTLRTPTLVTAYTGNGTSGTAISTTTISDPATGLVTETRMPSDTAGTTAGTELNTYYTAGTTNNTNCINSAWAKLLCKTSPKSQPGVTGLPGLVTKQYTYDYLFRPTVVTETAAPNNGTGTPVTRTTTTTYENSGYSPRTATVAVTGGVGTAIPTQTSGYDSSTGLPTTLTASGLGSALTTGYDDFGRVTSFTDADGAAATTSYDTAGRVSSSSRTIAGGARTTVLGYDTTSIVAGGTDHRGLTTSQSDTDLAGTATAVYDGGGALRTYTYANGITAAYTTDETGDTIKLAYSKSGTNWYTDAQTSDIHGQWRTHLGLGSQQTYTYDGIGRLTNTTDIASTTGGCVQRTYAFANTAGLNSNRSSLTTNPAAADGTCQTTTSTVQTLTYDPADRLQSAGPATGVVYDTFGRTTTLPASLAGSGGADVTNGYYTNDLVASQSTTSPARTKTWQLDASESRFRTFTDNATGTVVTKTNHYSSSAGDSPDWINEGDGTSTDYLTGLDGNLYASTRYNNSSGAITAQSYQLTNLHGDVATTASPSASIYDGAVGITDDFGNPTVATSTRYGWLGGKQRSTDTLGGVVLMGVRLYTPTLGRFLQTDPVKGGSANSYDYVNQDPINNFDLHGRMCFRHCHWRHMVGRALSSAGGGLNWVSTVLPGPQALLGGSIGTLWQVQGARLQMDHYGPAERKQLMDQLKWGMALNVLSAAMGRYGSRIFIHAVNSISNTNTQTASMGRRHYQRNRGWDD